MYTSTLPRQGDIKPVVLDILSDWRPHKTSSIIAKCAKHFNLTKEQLEETDPSNNLRFAKYCRGALDYLKRKHQIISHTHGFWKMRC